MRALPLQKEMCPSCPFMPGSRLAALAPDIARSACTQSLRICHSTGSRNAVNHRTGKPRAVCMGAREVQLNFFAARGLISEPTEEAWQETCDILGVKNGVCQAA